MIKVFVISKEEHFRFINFISNYKMKTVSFIKTSKEDSKN